MTKCFNDYPTVEVSSAFILYSSMKNFKDSTVGNTIVHVMSSQNPKIESRSVPGHGISRGYSFASRRRRVALVVAFIFFTWETLHPISLYISLCTNYRYDARWFSPSGDGDRIFTSLLLPQYVQEVQLHSSLARWFHLLLGNHAATLVERHDLPQTPLSYCCYSLKELNRFLRHVLNIAALTTTSSA